MNKKFRQIINSLLLMCALNVLLPQTALTALAANTARVSFSDPTVTVGEEVSVTMKFASTDDSILGDTNTQLRYDATLLEYLSAEGTVDGGAGSLTVRSQPTGQTAANFTLRFKALQAGTAKVTIASTEGYNNDGQVLGEIVEGNSTITINPLPTSSTDATLKTLQIEPGTLTPAFTPQSDAFAVTVGLDTDRLTVTALANNDGAKVAITGHVGLIEGENTVICTVTAEDGVTTKDYAITVNKVAGGDRAPGEPEAEGSAPKVLADLKSEVFRLQVLAFEADARIPEGLKERKVFIGETEVMGWVPDTPGDVLYCIFYGIDERGNKGYYRYDRTDKTIQRYFPDLSGEELAAAKTELAAERDANDKLLRDLTTYKYLLWGAAGIGLLLLVLLIVSLLTRKKAPPQSAGPQPTAAEDEALATYIPAPKRSMSTEERYMRGEEVEGLANRVPQEPVNVREYAYKRELGLYREADFDEDYEGDYEGDYDERRDRQTIGQGVAGPSAAWAGERAIPSAARAGQGGAGPSAMRPGERPIQSTTWPGERATPPAVRGGGQPNLSAASVDEWANPEGPRRGGDPEQDDFEIFDL